MKRKPHNIPPLERGLAISAYREQLTVPEIAEALGRSVDSIYRLLHRAGYGKTKPWNKPRLSPAVRFKKSSMMQTENPMKRPKGWHRRKRLLIPNLSSEALKASLPSVGHRTGTSPTTHSSCSGSKTLSTSRRTGPN